MDDQYRFIGGMRSLRGKGPTPLWPSSKVNATWPLAELLVDGGNVRVQLRYQWMRRLFARQIPDFAVGLGSAEAKPIGRTPATSGIFLAGTGEHGYDSVIFWCFKETRGAILELLRQRGVKIDQPAVDAPGDTQQHRHS